jgi:hypothetical protein
MPKCQVCDVNELIDDDEIAIGMCHNCLTDLMDAGVYCD